MTITVKPEVDEAPVFTKGQTSHEYSETDVVTAAEVAVDSSLTEGDPDVRVYTFEAYDPEDGAVSYELSGADKDLFSAITAVASTTNDTYEGALAFKAQPDYEKPGDANKDNIYEVTLEASATNTGETEKSTSIDITVEVKNVNEGGEVSLSAREPRIGVPITARVVSDDDGAVTNVAWQWERDTTGAPSPGTPTPDCDADTLAWEDAKGDGATTSTYTPNSADDGKCLRVTANYTDPAPGQGTANEVSAEAVEKARNLAPSFRDDDNVTDGIQINPRYVTERNAAGATVIANKSGSVDDVDTAAPGADRVLAEDDLDAEGDDNDEIDYSLRGPGASLFAISDDDGSTVGSGGLITVKDANSLDYEAQRSYRLTVTATDLEGLSSSVMVTINVVNVNEGPEIKEGRLAVSGPPLVPYTSMSTDDVATYTAVGVDAPGATWDLSGDDAGDFSISTTGVLTFATPPDSANPADANMDNIYEVTVEATSGGETADKDVTVTVGMADASADPTSLSDFTNQQRFDLDGNGIVDDSELRQAIIIWIIDNPEN